MNFHWMNADYKLTVCKNTIKRILRVDDHIHKLLKASIQFSIEISWTWRNKTRNREWLYGDDSCLPSFRMPMKLAPPAISKYQLVQFHPQWKRVPQDLFESLGLVPLQKSWPSRWIYATTYKISPPRSKEE